jgi:hypothetical protein
MWSKIPQEERAKMDFIINYWYVIVGILAVLVVAVFAIYHFFGLPTEKQLVKIKEWLKYAVALAEQELGGGTGQLMTQRLVLL